MNQKNLKLNRYFFVFTLMLTSCATHFQDASIQDPYGFFFGVWHGLILPFSFIGWLFLDGVYVIGQPNTGGTYITGFIFGLICLFGTAGSS